MVKREIVFEAVHQLTLKRDQPDRNGGSEIADRRDGGATDQEERVDISGLQLLGGWTGPQEFAGQILLAEPGARQKHRSVCGSPGTHFAERNAFALKIRQPVDRAV